MWRGFMHSIENCIPLLSKFLLAYSVPGTGLETACVSKGVETPPPTPNLTFHIT